MTPQEIEDLRSRRQSLKDLEKVPGWLELTRVVREQVEHRKALELSFDIEKPEDTIALVKLKAERRALLLLLDLPASLVEGITIDLEEEEEDGSSPEE